jgi:hypothetical protein
MTGTGATVSTTAGSRVESSVVLLTCPPCLQPLGVDTSDTMIAMAQMRWADQPSATFHRGDAKLVG